MDLCGFFHKRLRLGILLLAILSTAVEPASAADMCSQLFPVRASSFAAPNANSPEVIKAGFSSLINAVQRGIDPYQRWRWTEEAIRKGFQFSYEQYLRTTADPNPMSFEGYYLLVSYRSGRFYQINKDLRKGQVSPEDALIVKGLTATLKQLENRKFEGRVYRVINVGHDEMPNFLKEFVEGGTYTDRGFGSASPATLNWTTNILFVIKSKAGIHVHKGGKDEGGENEVLFLPGTTFKVNRILRGDPHGQLPEGRLEWTIELQELPN